MGTIGGNSSAQLKSIIERVENVAAEIQAKREDIKQIYAEAEGNGLDKKALKAIVAQRKQDAAKREELQQVIDTYLNALGELADTPLGRSAIERVSA